MFRRGRFDGVGALMSANLVELLGEFDLFRTRQPSRKLPNPINNHPVFANFRHSFLVSLRSRMKLWCQQRTDKMSCFLILGTATHRRQRQPARPNLPPSAFFGKLPRRANLPRKSRTLFLNPDWLLCGRIKARNSLFGVSRGNLWTVPTDPLPRRVPWSVSLFNDAVGRETRRNLPGTESFCRRHWDRMSVSLRRPSTPGICSSPSVLLRAK